MKKTILASVAATALIAGIGAASAAEPGEEAYFHERGNLDAAIAQRGPAPDASGLPHYGYDRTYQNQQGPLGYGPYGQFGPFGGYDADD
jgi:hypothetical protein